MSRTILLSLVVCLSLEGSALASLRRQSASRGPRRSTTQVTRPASQLRAQQTRFSPTLGRPKRLLPVGELVSFLFDQIKPGAASSDWHPIPGTGDKKFLGWVHEAEAKFQVPEARMLSIKEAMAKNDLEAFFGPELGAELRGKGFFLEKQVKDVDTVSYADPYLDTPDLRATRQGISIRHRQISQQIGTDNGMLEIKLYTLGKEGPVQERLEVRFRTDSEYSFKRMLSRDPAVEAWNPIAYLEKFDPGFIGQTLTPAVNLKNERLEYQLKGPDGKGAYLLTLDRVFGTGRPVEGGPADVSHNEFEMEQMFADDTDTARDRLNDLTNRIEQRFTLTRSTLNKPGTVAQNLGMLE